MGKTNGDPNMVCKKTIATDIGMTYENISLVRVRNRKLSPEDHRLASGSLWSNGKINPDLSKRSLENYISKLYIKTWYSILREKSVAIIYNGVFHR